LKATDIGFFDPGMRDSSRDGVVSDGKSITYVDVYVFVDRVESLQDTYAYREIIDLMPTVFRGHALHWWTQELYPGDRRGFRCEPDARKLVAELMSRFGMTRAELNDRWLSARFTSDDLLREKTFRGFVQRQRKLATILGFSTRDFSFVSNIFKLEPRMQELVSPPPPGVTPQYFEERLDHPNASRARPATR
jgi:hypothetical protein